MRNSIFVVSLVAASAVVSFSSSVYAAQYGQVSQSATITAADEKLLLERNDPEMLNVLGRRLIDPHHYEKGTKEGLWPSGDNWAYPEQLIPDAQRQAYLGYGKETFDHWKSANEYVLKNYARFPTIQDLLQVQAHVFYNPPGDMFWGYYRYQIWADFPAEKRAALYALLDKAQTDVSALEQLFKAGIKNGRGALRTTGDTAWSGLPWNTATNSSMLYSPAEFDAMKANSLLRPEVKSVTPAGIDAKFWHPSGKDVEKLLTDLFDKTKKEARELRLNRAALGDEYRSRSMYLAADYYRQLVLIHPTWDGVGRTSKVMRDWLLRYLGFVPPESTPENDLELTSLEYSKILDDGVKQSEIKLRELATTPSVRAVLEEAVEVGVCNRELMGQF